MWRERARAFAWILALLPAEGRTQPAAPCPPEFETLRYDEDYSCLADPNARRGWLDAIKYIPIPLGSSSYLSLGGEARLRYDYKHNSTWGQDPQDRPSCRSRRRSGAARRLGTPADIRNLPHGHETLGPEAHLLPPEAEGPAHRS